MIHADKMNDDLDDYLISELGFQVNLRKPGLDRAINAFLGKYLLQKRSIQEQAIDPIYDGKDALLVSETASGKTEAAFIPVTAKLLINPEQIALYIAPTKALLNDIKSRLEAPLREIGLDALVKHGDVALPTSIDRYRLLMTTPESLDVMLSKRNPFLQKVNYIILDEIHQLVGNPRGDQLLFLVQRLENFVNKHIQLIALSATVGNPNKVAQWLCPSREPATIIRANERKEIICEFKYLSELSEIKKYIVESKCNKLLCFANSRRKCDEVFLEVKKIENYQSFIHYSSLSTEMRRYVERGFKSTQMAICIATSTLELGIDIGSVEKVLIIDPPFSISSFMQRIGRGGRRSTETQVTFLPTNKIELLKCIALLYLGGNGIVEDFDPGKPYSVIVQQIFSIIAGKSRLNLHIKQIEEIFNSLPWLEKESIRSILEKLVDKSFLIKETPNVYHVGQKLERLIEKGDIYSNIVDSGSGIPIYHEGKLLTRGYLLPKQKQYGNVLLFAGRYWKIIGISEESINVQLTKPVSYPIILRWPRKTIFATSFLLAQGMKEVLINKPSFEKHILDDRCKNILRLIYTGAADINEKDDSLWVEEKGGKPITYTFAGSIRNFAIRLLLEDQGYDCEPLPYADEIGFTTNEPIDIKKLPQDPNIINKFLIEHWRDFSGIISSGPYFNLLPSQLKKEEVISQIVNSSLIEYISNLHNSTLRNVKLPIF